MNYTSLIFDFDGTLFDTRYAIAATLRQTLQSRGAVVPDDDRIWATIRLGITLEETFESLLQESAPDRVKEWVIAYREIYNGGLGVENSSPFPGIPELMRELSERGSVIVICSNKGRQAVELALSHFGMSAVATMIVAADGPEPTKPDPASFFGRIRPAIGDDASSRPLVIGDTDADIRYARAIGADACWVAYGYGDPALCRPLFPEFQASVPGDLHSLLLPCNHLEELEQTAHE